ncbi:hypothetical protein SAMN05414137_1698, partial [Streptacidiphilus jiangxiensis]
WVGKPDFPAAQQPDSAATGGRRAAEQFPAAAVDAWVRKHEEKVWLATHQGEDAARRAALESLPEGSPTDLLDLDDFGTILGNYNRGKPLGRGTMQSYRSRDQIPPADRRVGDGKAPEVYEDMWFRETVYDHVVDQLGMGARGVPKPKKI